MLDPFLLVPVAAFWPIWSLTLLAFLVLWAIQFGLGRRLSNATATSGIVSLELAGTSATAEKVLASWDTQARRDATRSVEWDFAFIMSYALVLSHSCAWASRIVCSTWGWSEGLGFAIVAGVWVAAACDVFENLALLAMLRGGATKARATRAYRFAVAKFLLILVGLAFAASGVVAWSTVLAAIVHYAVTHLGFVLVLIVVYGFVFGLLGTGNGIPSLFWHDDPLIRVSASCAVTLLLLDLGVISYYEVRDKPAGLVAAVAGPQPWSKILATPSPRDPKEIRSISVDPLENARYLRKFLGLAGWPLLSLLALPAVLPALFPNVPRIPLTIGGKPRHERRWYGAWAWLAGIALGLAIAESLLRSGPWLHVKLFGDAPAGLRESVLTFYLLFIGIYVLMAATPLYRFVSPAVAVSALMAVLAMTYAMVTYFDGHFFPLMRDWWVPPRVVLIAGLFALFGWANRGIYKLQFPNMKIYYPEGDEGLVPLREVVSAKYQLANASPPQPADGAILIDDRATLDAWRSRFPTEAGQPKPTLAVIAVSGGATRSAYWVATVLDRLEKEIPGFSEHVRIITGASGGMLGTAFYVKELKDRVASPGRAPEPYKTLIPWDSIKPVSRFIALRELWRSLLPFRWDVDRGVVLEIDWGATRSRPDDPRIQIPIQELGPREATGEIPSLIFSPMTVEDGRRLLISNLDLWDLSGADGSLITEDDPGTRSHDYSLSAFEFFRLFPHAKEFQVATAVRMSASFPFVSPAVNLPTDPPRRVVDAGYYDNYGVQVCSAWIQKHLGWLAQNTSGVVVIQIRDAVSQKDRLEVADAPTGLLAAISRGFQFFTSPLDAADKARNSVSAFQNDQAIENLSDMFTERVFREIDPPITDQEAVALAERDARAFFTTAIFENSAVINYGRRDPDSWPGDTAKGVEPTNEVALDWYLSLAEREGLDTAIPTPPENSPWLVPAERLKRIEELRSRVAQTYGSDRDRWLNELEQARNYERVFQLKQWWV